MANKFEVQVVALDRFTKTFRDLNNQASKAARPLVNVHRQVGALAREMHLDKMAAGMGKVTNAALGMTRAVGLSLGPLEGVLGIGAAGGIIGGIGAAAVGLTVLTAKFAGSAAEAKRTSDQLGIQTDQLQAYRAAARLAHVDQDALTQGMFNLREALWGAETLSDPKAAQALEYLGVKIRHLADGSIDVIGTMRDLSDVLKGISDPHVRNAVAETVRLDPESLRFLQLGTAEIDKLLERAKRLGAVDGREAIKWSEDFTKSLDELGVAAEGAWHQVGKLIGPALGKGLQGITNSLTATNATSSRSGFLEWYTGVLGKGAGPLFGAPFKAANTVLEARRLGMEADASRNSRIQSGLVDGPSYSGPFKPPAAGTTGGPPDPGPMRMGPDGKVDPEWQRAADARALSMVRQELSQAVSPEDRAALTRELARREAAAGTGKLSVEVNFKNAPPGTTATARTPDGAFVPTRVSTSLPSGAMP